jgi:hypothetical protein
MKMSLVTLVTGRGTGAFGTFEVVDGNVTKNRTAILQFFNETTALVPMTARIGFTTPVEHSAFDETLMALSSAGVTIQYVETVAKFMDPKARFAEWLRGQLTPVSVGLKLTAEELAVPSAYETAKAKFVALFTPPQPILSAGGIDTITLFGEDNALQIDRWRKGERTNLPSSVTTKCRIHQRTHGLLKIVAAGGAAYKVQNDQGHFISRTRFLSAWREYIKPAWDRGAGAHFRVEATEKNSYRSGTRQDVSVTAEYISIGCQYVPRAEVERIVAEFEKLGITK